jgi:dipeptidyl aminopeptidase/acylaminoacyl peptidase
MGGKRAGSGSGWLGWVWAIAGTLSMLCAAGVSQASVPRTISHEDLWTMERVGAPRVSPDGRWVVFQVTLPSYEERGQRADLWLVPADGSAPARRLTDTAGREAGVDWSPDGSQLAFAARRAGDDADQIYVLPLRGPGEAFRLTNLATGAASPVFSPDGRSIAFTSLVYPGAADDAANRRAIDERRARKWNARIYEGFPIRNWDRWLDDRRPSLFVVDLPASGLAAAPARDLLAGSRLRNAPGYAGRSSDSGADLDPAWTPDGESLVFVASDDRHRAAYAFTSQQLWLVARSGGEPTRLTEGQHSWSRPGFTPDGRRLIAQVERRRDTVYSKTELAVIDWSGPERVVAPRWISAALDRSVGSHAVTPDSRRVYFTAEEHGHEKLFEVPVSGAAAPRKVFEPASGVYTNLAIAPRGRASVLLANWESARSPPEIVRIEPDRGTHVALSAFTADRVAGLDLPAVRHFWFTSRRGRRIHSMLVLPPGFDASRRYPLFNMIHGGPHTMWRDQWFLRWNYHLVAAPGYVVLLTNYTGSTGFGEGFAQAIQGDPLRTPGEELNEAVDAALREFPFIDGQRHCAGGASYGGHLANWLQATTTRYRCLVSHAGLVNLESQWGTSDTVYGREVNNGGPVWEQGPVWREQNPIRYAGQFRTPTLVTIGEQDFRVPLNNSLEYWTALQRMQVPSRLVVFPDENHWILKGENSRLFYREIHDWLGRWIGAGAAAP